jgi:hypothetical protein
VSGDTRHQHDMQLLKLLTACLSGSFGRASRLASCGQQCAQQQSMQCSGVQLRQLQQYQG